MPLRSVKVRDHMVRQPILVHPDTPLLEAMERILTNKISGVAVVDQEQCVVGMLSELDCLKALLAGTYHQEDVGALKVAQYMVRDVECVRADEDIVDVGQSMLDHKHRRRPVIDSEGRVIGQLTCRSILGAIQAFNEPR